MDSALTVESEFPRTEKTKETYSRGCPQHYMICIVKVQGFLEDSH